MRFFFIRKTLETPINKRKIARDRREVEGDDLSIECTDEPNKA
jgi:hypothetical protein